MKAARLDVGARRCPEEAMRVPKRLAVLMLGWELLFYFKVLPIRLEPR